MTATDVRLLLAEPFPAGAVGWKPQATSKDGKSALAAAYIDARDVMDRLDAVVGIDGWQDEYAVGADGTVLCKLKVRIAGEWITKSDAGGESDQPDRGDKRKAAVSDALKRAAVKFGIGRYLYSLPQQWCPFDGRKFTSTPSLPDWALPRPGGVHAMSESQERVLLYLLKASQADVAKFCSAFDIKEATRLPREKWNDAAELLLRKAASLPAPAPPGKAVPR